MFHASCYVVSSTKKKKIQKAEINFIKIFDFTRKIIEKTINTQRVNWRQNLRMKELRRRVENRFYYKSHISYEY